MKLKRFALRAMVTLAVVVALCMFFSGTVRTITTPKVKIVTTKEGKLEQTANLSGKLTFPTSEEFRLTDARNVTLLVDEVYVRAGYTVKEGDILFTATVTDYEEKLDKIKADYDDLAVKLSDLERANTERPNSTTRTTQYSAIVARREVLHERTLEMRLLAEKEGVTLSKQPTTSDAQPVDWLSEARAQNGSDDLLKAIESVNTAQAALDHAQEIFKASGKNWRLAVTEETWKYITERNQYIADMDDLDQQRIDLELLKERLSTVYAPRDGYVTDIKVKAGEQYDGKGVAYSLNAVDAPPVLRADISDVQMNIEKGAAVTIKQNYYEISTTVSAIGMNSEGKKYADIAVTDELIEAKGGVYSMMLADVSATVTSRAAQATTLIPASAVRSEGEGNDYVYQIQYQSGSFTGSGMIVVKTPVTVLGRSDKLVSVSEDMYNARLADKEDRAISDGSAVMEYVS